MIAVSDLLRVGSKWPQYAKSARSDAIYEVGLIFLPLCIPLEPSVSLLSLIISSHYGLPTSSQLSESLLFTDSSSYFIDCTHKCQHTNGLSFLQIPCRLEGRIQMHPEAYVVHSDFPRHHYCLLHKRKIKSFIFLLPACVNCIQLTWLNSNIADSFGPMAEFKRDPNDRVPGRKGNGDGVATSMSFFLLW